MTAVMLLRRQAQKLHFPGQAARRHLLNCDLLERAWLVACTCFSRVRSRCRLAGFLHHCLATILMLAARPAWHLQCSCEECKLPDSS